MENLKKYIICSMESLLTVEGYENYELVLVTAAGTIIGKTLLGERGAKVKKKSEEDLSSSEIINNDIEDRVGDFIKANKIEDVLPGNDGFILLDDVKLVNQGQTLQFPSLMVFFDQVIACYIGDFSDQYKA